MLRTVLSRFDLHQFDATAFTVTAIFLIATSRDTIAQSRFGAPLDRLSPVEIAAFNEGREEFEGVETPEHGLGPLFNGNSCLECHSSPASGGSSDILVTRFGQVTNRSFDPLNALGGSLLHEFAINPIGRARMPREANVVAMRQSTPLFGLGLIEAIPAATILRGVRRKPFDGVKGRASIVADVATGTMQIGRFGWKGQHAKLLSFAGDAYVNELGITNRLFPTENAPNGNIALLRKLDLVADPEDKVDPVTKKAGIDKLTDFMRFLAPPPKQPMEISTLFGAKLFVDVGCVQCHTPMMMTGSSNVPALNRQMVMLYSDLLLHDMGSLNDGIEQGAATGQEMKTPPLWGLRSSGPYLHDGRAATVDEAIKAHDGEAKVSKGRYQKLSPQQQKLLVQFLMSI